MAKVTWAEKFKRSLPYGTPVRYWPGRRDESEGIESRTRSAAPWQLGDGSWVVAVEGKAGGIALTHVEPIFCGWCGELAAVKTARGWRCAKCEHDPDPAEVSHG